jgi:hypothetical protein
MSARPAAGSKPPDTGPALGRQSRPAPRQGRRAVSASPPCGRSQAEVSMQEGIGSEAVIGIIRRHVHSEVDWNKLATLEQVGVDEISLKKGHKDFLTIVSARIAGQIELLAELKDRQKATVKKFLQSLPNRLKKRLNPYVLTSHGYLRNILGTYRELFDHSAFKRIC